MQTFRWTGGDEVPGVVIHHDGNYRGDVYVQVFHTDHPDLVIGTLSVPAQALVAFAKQAVGTELTTLLEQNGFA